MANQGTLRARLWLFTCFFGLGDTMKKMLWQNGSLAILLTAAACSVWPTAGKALLRSAENRRAAVQEHSGSQEHSRRSAHPLDAVHRRFARRRLRILPR